MGISCVTENNRKHVSLSKFFKGFKAKRILEISYI
jgi:hypothetical protein